MVVVGLISIKHRLLPSLAFLLFSCTLFGQSDTIIYLLPGQGSDQRIFSDIQWPEGSKIRHIQYPVPDKGMSMKEYATLLASQIDADKPSILIGVSLGGMLAVELSEIIQPHRTIIISSAKSKYELPKRYLLQRKTKLHTLLPPCWFQTGALILQPIVEPDRRKNKNTFIAMLKDKDPIFLKRTVAMIVEWDREIAPNNIIHIHGTKDRTLPHRHVDVDISIHKGSHMMALTRAEEINPYLMLELQP